MAGAAAGALLPHARPDEFVEGLQLDTTELPSILQCMARQWSVPDGALLILMHPRFSGRADAERELRGRQLQSLIEADSWSHPVTTRAVTIVARGDPERDELAAGVELGNCASLHFRVFSRWNPAIFRSLPSVVPRLRVLTVQSDGPLAGELVQPWPFLTTLQLKSCTGLKAFPDFAPGQFAALTVLSVQLCAKLTGMSGTLGALLRLEVHACPALASLQNLQLPSLEFLRLSECNALKALPASPLLLGLEMVSCNGVRGLPDGPWPRLTSLVLRQCAALAALPATLGACTHLRVLEIAGCRSLKEIPAACSDLTELELFSLSGLPGLAALTLPRALRIKLAACTALASLSSSSQPGLAELDIEDCNQLSSVPDTLLASPALVAIRLSSCASVAQLPASLPALPALRTLSITGCARLVALPDLPAELEELELRDCPALQALPASMQLTRPARVTLHGLPPHIQQSSTT